MSTVNALIAQAKLGDEAAINSLMARYRNYLAVLLTSGKMRHRQFQNRFDSSDVVQNTLLDAFRDLPKFLGSNESELLAWLRQLLACNLADLARSHRAEKRDVNRQVRFNASLSKSSQRLERLLPQQQPQGYNSKQEALVMLTDTLAQLPSDYRQVIIMRHLQKNSFDEIALKLGRTPGAVRMLWTRAIASLKLLGGDD